MIKVAFTASTDDTDVSQNIYTYDQAFDERNKFEGLILEEFSTQEEVDAYMKGVKNAVGYTGEPSFWTKVPINKIKLSKKKFFGYAFRHVVLLYKEHKYSKNSFLINLYSNIGNNEKVLKEIEKKLTDKSYNVLIEHVASKEQDLLSHGFICKTMDIDEHRVEDWKYFAYFDYNSDPEAEDYKFELGDVVARTINEEGELKTEIGVVIQVYKGNEVRTDMFGNESENNLSYATMEQIKTHREDIIKRLKY